MDGYRTFTKEYQTECALGKNCCKFNKNATDIDDKLYSSSEFVPFDPSQEPIFPPELQLNDSYDKETLYFTNTRGVKWFRPNSLVQLIQIKQEFPDAKIITGNTEVGVEIKLKNMDYKNFISPVLVRELNEVKTVENGIQIGASVDLSSIEKVLKNQIETLPGHETKIYKAIIEMLHYFGGKQIRNVASIGGNIMTASPISDLNPILLAAGVE